jgi:hypothetical protein
LTSQELNANPPVMVALTTLAAHTLSQAVYNCMPSRIVLYDKQVIIFDESKSMFEPQMLAPVFSFCNFIFSEYLQQKIAFESLYNSYLNWADLAIRFTLSKYCAISHLKSYGATADLREQAKKAIADSIPYWKLAVLQQM